VLIGCQHGEVVARDVGLGRSEHSSSTLFHLLLCFVSAAFVLG
jgi:hypothetical protein